MRPICVLCGRPTQPAVMIGSEAVGPKCARKAGFTAGKAPKGARIRFLGRAAPKPKGPYNLDLFDDTEDHEQSVPQL